MTGRLKSWLIHHLPACTVCGSVMTQKMRHYTSGNTVFTGMHIRQCMACGMAYAAPMPSEQMLDEYNAGFFDHLSQSRILTQDQKDWLSAVVQLRIEYLLKSTSGQLPEPLRVLEVGPGPGFFPLGLRQRGFQFGYLGVETDVPTREELKQLGLDSVGSLENVSNTFNLCVMSHVLEHVTDPVRFVNQWMRHLEPGGLLFIEVPCRDYLYKTQNEPHLLFFDCDSMRRLMRTCGLSVLGCDHFGRTLEELKANQGRIGASQQCAWELPLAPWSDEGQRKAVQKFSAHVAQHTQANWVRLVARKTA
ncbi:MAG: class I SAM-dependent methyltransferase [Candidatus Methylacidiphilales bacterium]